MHPSPKAWCSLGQQPPLAGWLWHFSGGEDACPPAPGDRCATLKGSHLGKRGRWAGLCPSGHAAAASLGPLAVD